LVPVLVLPVAAAVDASPVVHAPAAPSALAALQGPAGEGLATTTAAAGGHDALAAPSSGREVCGAESIVFLIAES
jgi:predicted TIM-barrel enzyme